MGRKFWAIIAVGVALGTLMVTGFGVIYSVLDSRFDGVNARFEAVDARFEAVDARLDRVDARIGSIDTRLDNIDRRLARVEGYFFGIEPEQRPLPQP